MPENNADSANNNHSTRQQSESPQRRNATAPNTQSTHAPASEPPNSNGAHKHRRIPHPPHKKHQDPRNKINNRVLFFGLKLL